MNNVSVSYYLAFLFVWFGKSSYSTSLVAPRLLQQNHINFKLKSDETVNPILATKCFADVGCVSGDDFIYNTTIGSTPVVLSEPQDIGVTFNLFTLQNPNIPEVFNYNPNDSDITDSLFSCERRTKFLIHGYMSGLNENSWLSRMKDYFLDHSDYNVYVVDWEKGASNINYFQSAADTRVVGAVVTNFIERLVYLMNATESDVHCVGHSLGAHVCGFAGKRLQRPKMEQISGLDPAGPGFYSDKNHTRLEPTDAQLVIVIHTNSRVLTSEGSLPIVLTGFVGNPFSLGHFDFWPNGGARQPGCRLIDYIDWKQNRLSLIDIISCNHNKAHELPLSAPKNSCQNIGYKCDNYLDFQNGKCAECGTDGLHCKPMEFDLDFWDNFTKIEENFWPQNTSKSGYYLKTSESQPFCLFHYQILVKISYESNSKVFGRLELTLSNGNKVSFPPPLKPLNGAIEIPLMSSFVSGTNYTQLYLNANELESTKLLTVKWTSLFWAKVKVSKISVNFMSHIERSIRETKSKDFCLKSDKSISSGSTLPFEVC